MTAPNVDGTGFEEIAVLCSMCLGAGELASVLDGHLRLLECLKCRGSGMHVLTCPAGMAADLADLAEQARMRRARTAAAAELHHAGICKACYASGRITWIERDGSDQPVRYAEADCRECSADAETP